MTDLKLFFGQPKKWLHFFVFALGLLYFCASVFIAYQRYGEAKEISVENADKILALRDKEQELINEKAKPLFSPSEVYSDFNKKGSRIAQLQNHYQTVVDNETAVMDIAAELDSFFAEDSKNARTPWYVADERRSERAVWRFTDPFIFEEDDITGLWLCENSKGDVYAYTLAKYNKDTKQFESVDWKLTGIGQFYAPFTGEVTNDAKEVTDLVDALNSLDMEPAPEVDGATQEEVKNAQWLLREQLMKEAEKGAK